MTASKLSALTSLLVLFASSAVGAEWPSSVRTHGFFSQGMVYTDENGFVEDDNGWSERQTEIGLNASWQINSDWRMAGQVVYLNGGNRYPEGFRLDYLLLDRLAYRTDTDEVHIQLGRYKNQHGLYRDSRDVPAAQPSIFLPQSVYWDMYRDQTLNTDGVALMGFHQVDAGSLEWQFSGGATDIHDDMEEWVLGKNSSGDYEEDWVVQGSGYYTTDNGAWTMGLSVLRSNLDFHADEGSQAVSGQAYVWESIASIRYSAERWETTFEYIDDQFKLYGLYFPEFRDRSHSDGYYLQVRYFATPSLTLLARYDAKYLNKHDRDGKDFEKQTGAPSYFMFSKDWTLGLTYEVAENWLVRGEYHYVHGAAWLPPHLYPDVEVHDQEYWHLFAVQLSYSF
ncbi:hypothetical protein ACFSJ3_10165 [Corallincola platygyrae]|uniref:Porin n=1 Tax=Corallincola platygyrae TaxID=1193278 RepID=A0ABW4XML4_9GAMM